MRKTSVYIKHYSHVSASLKHCFYRTVNKQLLFQFLCCSIKLVKLITWNICTSLILGLLNYPFPSSSTGNKKTEFSSHFAHFWSNSFWNMLQHLERTCSEHSQLLGSAETWEFTSLWPISCEHSYSKKGCMTCCPAGLSEQRHTNCPIPNGKPQLHRQPPPKTTDQTNHHEWNNHLYSIF